MRGKRDELIRGIAGATRAALAAVVIAGTVIGGAGRALADSPTVPDAPAQPSVATAGGSVTVTFTPPADGGSAVTSYTTSCVSSDGGIGGTNTGTGSPITVTPLDVGNTYSCRVIATNGIGDSAPSPASAAIIVLASAPDRPAKPVATPSGTSISLALDAPAGNGSPITQYDATCDSIDGGVEGTASSDSLPIVVDGLSQGKTYACHLTATNTAGTSPASPDSDSTLVDAVAPDAPGRPGVLPGDGDITVSFSPPGYDGGRAISQYTADCTSSDGGTESSATDTGSPIDVSGLDNGHTYTCTVTAANDAGASPASDPSPAVVAGTPTVAGGASVIPANQGAYVTYGDSISDSGDPITSYTAHCVSSDGGDPASATSATRPVQVTGLTNGSTYTCTLLATNSRGDGPPSDASDAFSPATIPGTPDAPTLTPGDQRITVAFVPPDDSGDPIASYDVACASSDGGTPGTASGAGSPIDVTGLDNTNTYTCTVRATNSTGTGLWSDPSEEVVVGPGAPDAPVITGITRGSNSVIVDFAAPDDHDSPISAYTVTCTSDDGGAPQTATGDSAPIEVDGLTNSRYYTCTVDATNDQGTSPESSTSDQFLAAAEPDAPVISRVLLGSNAATVTVVAPAGNGEPITNYEATCTSGDGDTGVADSATTTITVTGLTNGSTYTCAVTATNVMGTGNPSSDSAPFVAATRPDPPVITDLTRGRNAATISFDAPWDGSAAITAYTVTCTSSDGGTTRTNRGTSSPITVASLSNSFTYSCTVRAANPIGDGPESDPSDDFVAATTPRPPMIGAITLTPGAASVALASAGDGSDAILGYGVTCNSSNGGVTQSGSAAVPVAVAGLTTGKTYTCLATAANLIGTSAISTRSRSFVAAVAPAAPALRGVARGANSANIVFTTPANNGSPITGYVATCTSSDGGAIRSAAGTKSPIIVTLLSNANTYTCAVSATNAIGAGPASPASSAFIAASIPGVPTVTGAARASGTVSVSFTAPDSNGGAVITSYRITCASANGGRLRTGAGASSPVVISGLTNGKAYTCTVLAVNAIGTGTASSASSSFVAASVPAAPRIASITRGTNSASIAFASPANNGDAISGYTVTCTSVNGGVPQTVGGSASPLVVAALTNAKSYSCRVLATNGVGNSAASAGSTFVAGAAPDAPVISGLVSARGTVTISFTPPNANGAAITRYTATCTSSDGGTTRSGSYSRSAVNVTNLSIGNTYACTLTATNALGTSAASPPSTTFVA
ncbi:MAG TPA: fibronectin type III domain-containing protein [Acidimicrobiia bacterium]|nr:fibronectin type III domain-containing protein [Acidimicrobiia bacterium]